MLINKVLGVNIDHVATLRQARGACYPDPVFAAKLCEKAGANSIVAHLREDRRHIQDADIFAIKEAISIKLNMEMSIAEDIVEVALKLKPEQATLVPERRQELTTEGGLDVVNLGSRLKRVVERLRDKGIVVSLFIEPEIDQIKASFDMGVKVIELHTGMYSEAKTKQLRQFQLRRLIKASAMAKKLGLEVNAGHGLHYDNVRPIAEIPEIKELNIGHSIISYAVFFGLEKAVKDMLRLLQ